jgi:hypothetical protein
VRYFPREHVAMAFLQKTDKVTHCPYKGQASYYTIMRDAQIIENAVWSYETPLPGVSQIAGRLAFYPEHVDFKRAGLTAAETRAVDVDEVVRHTDSGSGSSQAEHVGGGQRLHARRQAEPGTPTSPWRRQATTSRGGPPLGRQAL